MTHEVIRVDNLMYRGCEPHWKCIHCGICIPFHCYSKSEIEDMECEKVVDVLNKDKLKSKDSINNKET